MTHESDSWWEIPWISYFVSLFKHPFNITEFSILEFEDSLNNDDPGKTEETPSTTKTGDPAKLQRTALVSADNPGLNRQPTCVETAGRRFRPLAAYFQSIKSFSIILY